MAKSNKASGIIDSRVLIKEDGSKNSSDFTNNHSKKHNANSDICLSPILSCKISTKSRRKLPKTIDNALGSPILSSKSQKIRINKSNSFRTKNLIDSRDTDPSLITSTGFVEEENNTANDFRKLRQREVVEFAECAQNDELHDDHFIESISPTYNITLESRTINKLNFSEKPVRRKLFKNFEDRIHMDKNPHNLNCENKNSLNSKHESDIHISLRDTVSRADWEKEMPDNQNINVLQKSPILGSQSAFLRKKIRCDKLKSNRSKWHSTRYTECEKDFCDDFRTKGAFASSGKEEKYLVQSNKCFSNPDILCKVGIDENLSKLKHNNRNDEHKSSLSVIDTIEKISNKRGETDNVTQIDAQFTMTDLPSTSNNRNITLPQNMKRTTNFDKIWSIDKSHFKNSFVTSSSDEDVHISEMSSPIVESQDRKILTLNTMGQRKIELSEQIGSDIQIIDTSDESNDDNERTNKRRFITKKYPNTVRRCRKKIGDCSRAIAPLQIDHCRKVSSIEINDPVKGEINRRANAQTTVTNNINKENTKAFSSYKQSDEFGIDSSNCYKICATTVSETDTLAETLQCTPNCTTVIEDSCESCVQRTPDKSIKNKSHLQIQNNNNSGCMSQFVIENVSSPSETTISNNNNEIQFSECSSLDTERKTPPPKLIHNPSLNWEELWDSGSKKRRKKYPEDSLVGRLCAVRNRYLSEINFNQYMLLRKELVDGGVPILIVRAAWEEYSRIILKCYNEHFSGLQASTNLKDKCESSEEVVYEVCVLIDSPALLTPNVSSGTRLKIHPPWKILYMPDKNLILVLGVTSVEILSEIPSSGQVVEVDKESKCMSTVEMQFNCLCLRDCVENPECNFQLDDELLINTLCPQQFHASSSKIASQQKQKISRLYLGKNDRSETIGSCRAFRVLDPHSVIAATVLTVLRNNQFQKDLVHGVSYLVVKDSVSEIAVVTLSTEFDVIKWKKVSDETSKSDPIYKFSGLKFTHRLSLDNCKILDQFKTHIVTDQMHVYFLTPASDWWTVTE